MNLIATERVTWTTPAPAWARRMYRELMQVPKDQKKRYDALAAQLPMITQHRLHFASVTMAGDLKRARIIDNVDAWFREQYNVGMGEYNQWYYDTLVRQAKVEKSLSELTEGKLTKEVEAHNLFQTLRAIADWATLMTCLQRVECREVKMTEGESEGGWQTIEVPSAWMDFQKFTELVPRALFAEAAEICNNLNPGMWVVPSDDESKNVGGVSVN